MVGQKIRPLNTEPLLGHPKYMKVFIPCFESLNITDICLPSCHLLLSTIEVSVRHHHQRILPLAVILYRYVARTRWRSTCTGIQHITIRPSQVADLNRGAFGFVQLAKDVTTGEQVAIKFIERGDKVEHRPAACVLPGYQARGSTMCLCL